MTDIKDRDRRRAKIAALTAKAYGLIDDAATEITAITLIDGKARTAQQKRDLLADRRYVVVAKLVLLTLGLNRPEDDAGE